jgi:hypothetical protein
MTPGTIHIRSGKDYVIALHTTHSMNVTRVFQECVLMPFFLMNFNKEHLGYIRPLRVILSALETALREYRKTPTVLTVYRCILDWLARDFSFATSPEIFSNWIILRDFNMFAPLPHKNEYGDNWDKFKPDMVIDFNGDALPQVSIKTTEHAETKLSAKFMEAWLNNIRGILRQFGYLYRFNPKNCSVTYSPDKVLAALIALEWEREQSASK